MWLHAKAQPKKVPRIGYLSGSSAAATPDQSRINALRQGLGELGYVEGKNIIIEYRFADERYERLPGLATDLVRLNVDILVVRGAPAAHAAKNATRTIPIIIGNAADPVGTGLVSSLASPGGNITGLSDYNSGVITKTARVAQGGGTHSVSNHGRLESGESHERPSTERSPERSTGRGGDTALTRSQGD